MIDFKLIKSPEDFELFCEELLKTYGFTIISRSARGPGQGKDIICQSSVGVSVGVTSCLVLGSHLA